MFGYFYFLFNMFFPSCRCFSCYFDATVQVLEFEGEIHWGPHSNAYEYYRMYGIHLQQFSHMVAGHMFLLAASLYGLQSLVWVSWEKNHGNFVITNKIAISLIAQESQICFHMISVSLDNTRLNLLNFSDCQHVWNCYHLFWDSDKVNNKFFFFHNQ